MKAYFLVMLTTLFPFSIFSQTPSLEHTYSCKFNANLGSDKYEKSFTLGNNLGFVSLKADLNNQKHFFDFIIFNHEGNSQFQFMEGRVENETIHYPSSGFAMDILEGQSSLHARTFLCGEDYSCWRIQCDLDK